MKTSTALRSLLLLTIAALPLAALAADPVQIAAAKTFADRQDSTVTLTVTRRIQGRDVTFEIPAVSFDGKGLLVTALSQIESAGTGSRNIVLRVGEGGSISSGGQSDTGELIRVALLRPDATEAEADLVLRDITLDLAFIRLRQTDAAAAPIPPAPPLAKVAPALLETILTISRGSPVLQRVPTVALLQTAALITTPSALYVPSQVLTGGVAVYNLDGELLGIATVYRNQSVIVPVAAIVSQAAGIPAPTERSGR